MYLAVEIGGTKLQLAVGTGTERDLVELRRLDIDPSQGAAGIHQQISTSGNELISKHDINAVGIGFGGPVNGLAGKTIHSFQIDGWDDFPLVSWAEEHLKRPTYLANDSDMAGLGEATLGSGAGNRVVMYSNVGSGIGGSLVVDGHLYAGSCGITMEIGHIRPSVKAITRADTVESVSSGWGMTEFAHKLLADPPCDLIDAAKQFLSDFPEGIKTVDGKCLGAALNDGNALAKHIFARGIEHYGWALAQAITLLSPNIVVIGGGVPLLGDDLFLDPLREKVKQYVYGPLAGTYDIQPAALGEEVVLHGALILARQG